MAGGAAVLCGVVTLTWVLAGCGGSDGDAKAPATAPNVSQKPTSASAGLTAPPDPHADQKVAVLAAYNRMTTEQAKAYRQASAKGTALEKYATLDALSKIDVDLYRMKEAGTVVRGEIGHDAKVTDLDMTTTTPKASLSDCVDLSKYETYDTRTKRVIPLPTNQPLRYIATAKAERWQGRWMVTDINTQGGGSC
ncbi:hypothetical protein ACQPXS_46605 (plasmid) [Streptomyces sp. CA-142005]|uniref:hypothetical protein n=1 Tax=Streptomyces sp. CA-142005 TaxID=3240052 RepID=UPI003D908596